MDERYAAEVERDTSRLQRRYRHAQQQLWEAEQGLLVVSDGSRKGRRLVAEVNRLRGEVDYLAVLMTGLNIATMGSSRTGHWR
jgi:hypothetical protein